MAEIDKIPGGQLELKKRARRRLVGAAALALAAIIVLPMVMDQEPKPQTQDVQVRIPSQDAPRLSPLRPPDTKAGTASGATTTPGVTDDAKTTARVESSKPPVEARKQAAPGVQPRGEAVKPSTASGVKAEAGHAKGQSKKEAQGDGQWVLQLGAYREQANVRQLQAHLRELGYPTYTEKVETAQGPRTRVRGGPFATRQAAERAQAQLKKIGVGAPVGGALAPKQ